MHLSRRAAVFVLAMVLSPAGALAQGLPLPKVMGDLYAKHLPAYEKLRGGDFRSFCAEHGLDEKSPDNRDRYMKITFFQELLTGEQAVDCTSAGAFGIRYFWHWIEPNPRHAILKLPGETPLTRVPPPRRFSRYKSFADIDRVPSLFLSDLVSDAPAYRHPDCGDFYTFGWCSEREMAFVLLLSLFGYQGKIIQAGNHVTSFFWVSFIKADKSEQILIAEVDNTFGSITWSPAPPTTLARWRQDLAGARYANRMSRSPAERRRTRRIRVSKKAVTRLDQAVDAYLQAHCK